jgi:hypothetical protein
MLAPEEDGKALDHHEVNEPLADFPADSFHMIDNAFGKTALRKRLTLELGEWEQRLRTRLPKKSKQNSSSHLDQTVAQHIDGGHVLARQSSSDRSPNLINKGHINAHGQEAKEHHLPLVRQGRP